MTVIFAVCVAWTVLSVFVALAVINEARSERITISEEPE